MSLIAHRCSEGYIDIHHGARRREPRRDWCVARGKKATWHAYDEQPEVVATYRDRQVIAEIIRPGSIHSDFGQTCGCDACWALWEIHDGVAPS